MVNRRRQLRILMVAVATLALLGLMVLRTLPKHHGSTATIEDITKGIDITRSDGTDSQDISKIQAAPNIQVTASSQTINFNGTKANAASLNWRQYGEGGVSLLVRTFNGSSWSPWTEALQNDDRKDGVSDVDASTLILASNIERLEYTFTLKGSQEEPSAAIDLSRATLKALDTSKGPDGKPGITSRIWDLLSPTKKVSAESDSPRIISRAEWGSPEPNNAPDWEPEYASLTRAIIHHTATTETPNSYAAVRAIWQHHRYNNGWGDIGYNYIVDSVGNVFQGRYFDQTYAKANKVDVIGGHASGNNVGTTGIASIGNFQSAQPPAAMVHAIGRIIGYKLAPYSVADPLGLGPNGQVLVGHRDVLNTACPGNNLHIKLPEIRWVAHQYYERDASMNKLDYGYVGQQLFRDDEIIPLDSHLRFGENVRLEIKLRNTGTETWKNSGQFATRLATTHPFDRRSRFYDPSWISQNRVTTFTTKATDDGSEPASEVSPGETAIFSFKVTVPELATTVSNATLFKEYFGLVQDGRSWFLRDIGLHQPFIVKNNVYSWEWKGQSVFTNSSKTQAVPWGQPLNKNSRYYLQVLAKNTGSATWRKNQLRLGTSQPLDRISRVRDSTWISTNRVATISEETVAPGETAHFEFWIKTPDSTGFSSKEFFQPVNDGVTWLNDGWLHYPINVN